MLNLVTFDQLFHIFLENLEMQVDYMKTNRVVTIGNMHTHVHVQKDVIYFSIDILMFYLIVHSVIHQ